jgi:hypothetical protein
MDWLDSFVESFKDYESPSRYFYWSALAAISAVVKDKVWMDRGGLYKLYPNVYILLYGPSGIKKGAPIAAAKNIVRKVGNTRVINGRSTVEGIIKELGTVQSGPGKTMFNDSCGFIVSSELSSAIVSNPSAMDVMTDLFDRFYNEGEWKYRLKTAESNTLKSPTPVWLAGTNEALFKEFVPEKNIKGGLIGRMFIISETKRNRINSLMFRPTVTPDYDKLADGIKNLTKLQGEFEIADDVKHAMDKWYTTFVTDHEDKIDDDTGFVNRIQDMILKVAMLVSCARRGDQIITIEDMEEAVSETLPLIVPTKKVAQSVKINDISAVQKRALIIKDLANREDHSAGRVELLKKFSLQMDHEDLDRVIQFLESAQVIRTDKPGGHIRYSLNMSNEKVSNWIQENYKR